MSVRRPASVGTAAVGAVVAVMLCLPLLVVVVMARPVASACVTGGVGVAQLDAEQTASVSIIVDVVKAMNLSRRAAVIAVATAMQESGLRNLDHGDAAGPDSRGLFQQRPAYYSDIDPTVPEQAARGFLTRLAQVPGWETASLSDAAQAVQRSQHPELYGQHEQAAEAAVAPVWGDLGASPSVPTGCSGGVKTIKGGAYALPVAETWWQQHPEWFTQPHHDYPAADIPVPSGTTVFAAAPGTVIVSPTSGDCGNGLIIDGDDGDQYTYCHGTAPLVPAGVHVDAGTPVMVSGATGHVTGPHLHLQIANRAGTLVCPQQALTAWAEGSAVDVDSLPAQGCVSDYS